MQESISFYTNVLDFRLVGAWPAGGSASFSILERRGAEMHLSSFSGDGTFGNVVSVLSDDVEGTFRTFLKRGLDTSDNPDSPLHQGPVKQTWGTVEFYVKDPCGNTIRFIQR